MNSSSSILMLALALLPLGGCGKSDASNDAAPGTDPALPGLTPAPGTPAPPVKPAAKVVDRLVEAVPVETFLAGGLVIPARLNQRELTVSFRSNAPDAVFQCSVAGRDFAPCADGDHYKFAGLANGASQRLSVRARTALGEVDPTPLSLAFVVDFAQGSPASTGEAIKAPVSVEALLVARSLPLGSYFGVAVPAAADTSVATFSTDKTYNGRIETLRLMAESTDPCTRGYEKTVTPAGAGAYCEATPTRAQLNADYAVPKPRNHLEVVRYAKGSIAPAERLILAAFDTDADGAEGHMGLDDSCRGATASGRTKVVLFTDFYGEPRAGTLSWCQVRDAQGVFWWLGSFGYDSPSGAARLKGIYAASAALGIPNGQEFAARTGQLVQQVVVPVTPVP